MPKPFKELPSAEVICPNCSCIMYYAWKPGKRDPYIANIDCIKCFFVFGIEFKKLFPCCFDN